MISTNPNQPGTWRFTLLGVPVAVHWFFWVVAVLMGRPESADSPLGFQLLLIWVAVFFVSILVHEFGHAFAFRRFGGRPSVLLYGMGGLAFDHGRYSRNQNIAISAGGPAAGLLLGGLVWVLARWVIPAQTFSDSPHLSALFFNLMWVNIVWSLVNLLPIQPLDGGHLLGHIMRERQPKLRAQIGMACAAAMAFLGFAWMGSLFVALFFGYLAYQNYQRAQGTHRGFW